MAKSTLYKNSWYKKRVLSKLTQRKMPPRGSLSLSASHMAVVTTAGDVLLAGTHDGKPIPLVRDPASVRGPVPVAAAFGSLDKKVRAIASRGCLLTMITDDGELLCSNAPGFLFKYRFSSTAITQVALGHNFAAILVDTGHVFTYGYGRTCALGHQDLDDRLTPTLVPALVGHVIVTVAAGVSCGAVSRAGRCFTWGKSHYGHLGHGGTERVLQPTPIAPSTLGDARVQGLACGYTFMLAVCDEGERMFAWGGNRCGNMGVGDDGAVFLRPEAVDMRAFGGRAVRHVSCAAMHSVALTRCGAVYATGQGRYGALGRGDTRSSARFRRVELDTVVVDVSAATYTSAALGDDGALYTWGAGVLPVEDYAARRSQRLQEKNPYTTGVSRGIGTALAPARYEGLPSMGRAAGTYLTDEKKLAFAMGLHPRLGRTPRGVSGVARLSEDVVRKIFAVYVW
jgi:hypothetical protein